MQQPAAKQIQKLYVDKCKFGLFAARFRVSVSHDLILIKMWDHLFSVI